MLSELFLFQHLHYFRASHNPSSSPSSSSSSSSCSVSEKNKKGLNRNDENNDVYCRSNGRDESGGRHKNDEYRSNSDSAKKSEKSIKNYMVTYGQIYTEMDWDFGSKLILIPLGITTLPGSASISSLNEQNVNSLLVNGEFGTKIIDDSRSKNPALILDSEIKKLSKSVKSNYFDDSPLRFLVFPAIHVSLSSILPIILSYANMSNAENKKDNNAINNETPDKSKNKIVEETNTSAKNTQYYSKNVASTDIGVIKNSTRVSGINEIHDTVPPLSAFFSRDLCFDLLSAVNHCIDWYVGNYKNTLVS